MRLIDADELITAFPPGETVRTESVRATINHIQEQKTGWWINKSHRSKCGVVFIEFECSCCHKKVYDEYTATYQYCPNCGAKMKSDGRYEQELSKEEKSLLQKWRDNRGISMEEFEEAMNALQEQEPTIRI